MKQLFGGCKVVIYIESDIIDTNVTQFELLKDGFFVRQLEHLSY